MKLNKDFVLSEAKKRNCEINQINPSWPYNYNGNEAYYITDSQNRTIYVCFCSNSGELLAKTIIKKEISK